MGRKQADLYTKQSKQTTGKPRPNSNRQPRKDWSSIPDDNMDRSQLNVYHCEVYGFKNEKTGTCSFSSALCDDSDLRATKKGYQWIKRRQTCVLNDGAVLTTRPIYRVHSAPRKLAYLHRNGSESRTTDINKARSPGSMESSLRPQTAAPIVRELSDIGITGDTWDSSGDLSYSRPSTVDLTSDKHSSFPPEYSSNWELDHFSRVDREKSYVSAEKEHDTTDNDDKLINDPLKAIIESFTKRSDKSDVKIKGKEADLKFEGNSQKEFDDDMRKSETKTRVTFAECCLAETKYIHRQQIKKLGNNHEELIEQLRQSFGIDVDYKLENEGETPVKPQRVQCEQLSIATASESKPKALSIAADDVTKCLQTKQKRPVSSMKKAPFKKDGKAQGFLVKHLREQRTRKADKLPVAPMANFNQAVDDDDDRVKRNVRGLFLRTATFIWYACRLLGCMIDLSSELTTRSATEEQWHALNTSREARGMAFNKAAFAKRKDFTRVPKWAKRIMRKGPEDRSEQDVKRIHALLRGLKSFDRFTEKIQLSMCKSFVYYSIKSGRVVLRQGHVGQNFYFLFNGSVFVNIDDVDAKGNKFSKTEAVLGRGDSFGELALLQDIRRTATITCREDCEMLVVDKDTFARICPRIFEMELDEKMRFVSKMKLFNLRVWDEDSLRKMCFEAQIQEYKTNKVVVVDSEKDDWIYICMEGKCQVIRRLDLYHEIEWRKMNQHQMPGKSSRRMSRQDFLTVMTGMSNPSFRPKENPGSRRRSVSPAVKQNLLDSMGLEFLQNRRLSIDDLKILMELKLQQMRNRRSSKADLSTSLCQKGDYGPLTLTSLLANDEKRNGNHLFLNIHTVKPYDVFDLSSVLQNQEEMDESTGSHILVSLGSRLMRIKRSSYFKYASPDAIELAKGLAFKYMYPSDDVLLEQYRDFLRWEVYKYQVLQIALNQKKKSLDGKKQPKTDSSASTGDIDKAKALFELNKSTLVELNGILSNRDEDTNKAFDFQRMEELNSESSRRSSNTIEQISVLPSITLLQRQIQSEPELPSAVKPSSDPKPSHRRMSKVSVASEFKTIDETDEKD